MVSASRCSGWRRLSIRQTLASSKPSRAGAASRAPSSRAATVSASGSLNIGEQPKLAAPRPDLLISEDARLIAFRSGGTYWLQTHSGGSKFTREAWEAHLGSGPLLPISDGKPEQCGAELCRVGPVLLVRDKARAAEKDCAGVALLVSAEPARGECPRGVGLLDRFTVWRDSTHAVWIDGDGVRVLSDRAERGQRPWVPPPPTPRRVAPDLPTAPTETLPPWAPNRGRHNRSAKTPFQFREGSQISLSILSEERY